MLLVHDGKPILYRCVALTLTLSLYLARLDLIESQIAKLNQMIAEEMKPHEKAVVRLAELPGLGIDSAQQIIAEI